ncbi:MAG: sulfatase-like hydrolase/transferase [Phycisphaeraceae bacterium]|nr:sulfatase-like hydrolase/transferase [Phycisphaeraceae bacterium]
MKVLLSIAAVLSLVSPKAPQLVNSETSPNVLLIIADDLGTDMLKSYGIGKDMPKTPNLDALAKRSVLFRNAWGTPLCSPTRACIQTGRHGFRTGIGITVKDSTTYNGLDASEIILPEMLDAGTGERYRHALFGKWHLNHATQADLSGAPKGLDVVNVQGYDHFEGVIHNIVSPHSYVNWPKVTNGVERRSNTYATTATVDDFLSWESKSDAPYFVVLSFNAPHAPFHEPPKALYSSRINTSNLPKENPRPYYKAMVEALDFELGRLFVSLGASIDNTMIIFMSDNGVPSVVVRKDPNRVLGDDHCKGSAYEGGVNIPLMISGPRVTVPGSDCSALVHAVDIFATVAELAGVDLKDPEVFPSKRILDSKSMVPFLEEPNRQSSRQFNYTEKFFANTLSGAQIVQSQLAEPPLCQPVVELPDYESDLELTMCGQALVDYTDNQTSLRLDGAPPNSKAFLLVGATSPR